LFHGIDSGRFYLRIIREYFGYTTGDGAQGYVGKFQPGASNAIFIFLWKPQIS
jgi:hypothetical protein